MTQSRPRSRAYHWLVLPLLGACVEVGHDAEVGCLVDITEPGCRATGGAATGGRAASGGRVGAGGSAGANATSGGKQDSGEGGAAGGSDAGAGGDAVTINGGGGNTN